MGLNSRLKRIERKLPHPEPTERWRAWHASLSPEEHKELIEKNIRLLLRYEECWGERTPEKTHETERLLTNLRGMLKFSQGADQELQELARAYIEKAESWLQEGESSGGHGTTCEEA